MNFTRNLDEAILESWNLSLRFAYWAPSLEAQLLTRALLVVELYSSQVRGGSPRGLGMSCLRIGFAKLLSQFREARCAQMSGFCSMSRLPHTDAELLGQACALLP